MRIIYKRLGLIVILLGIACVLCSCGPSAVSESIIQQDVETNSAFANLQVETTDFSIIKRQTNKDEKIDTAYVCISGKNEDYEATRNYEVTYVLYNDGWMLETIKDHMNEETPNITTPLHGASVSDLEDLLFNLDYANYCESKYYDESTFDYNAPGGAFLPINENGECEFVQQVRYKCGPYDEIITMPVYYIFGGDDSEENSYRWHSWINGELIDRECVFNEDILGVWQGYNLYNLFGTTMCEIMIESYEGNRCYVSYLNVEDMSTSGWIYLNNNSYPGDIEWEEQDEKYSLSIYYSMLRVSDGWTSYFLGKT